MNRHLEIKRRLPAYCGGDLHPDELKLVEKHLAECPDCRAELGDLQTALRLLRSTPELEPPPWLTGRIMATVREQQAEKRSWLQRIFFPLHIKLPLEAIALLMVCVSGYYLTRTVETELQQDAGQQFQGVPAQAPARLETGQPPAASKKQADVPVRTMPKSVPQQVDLPVEMPPEHKTAPLPPPYAPAPPVDRDRSAGKLEVMKALPPAEAVHPAQETFSERRAKSTRRLEPSPDAAVPSAADRAAGAPAGLSVPPAMIRLSINGPAASPATVREAVLSSGGMVTEGPDSRGNRLKIHLPAARLNELLERLARLGRISERPAAPSPGNQLLEMTIQW